MGLTCSENKQKDQNIHLENNEQTIKKKKKTFNEEEDKERNNKNYKDKNNTKKRNSIKKNNEKSTIKKSYNNLDLKTDYYLLCPKCEQFSPIIQELDYNSEKNDFNITYICNCKHGNSKSQECNLIDLINTKKPENFKTLNISNENMDKLNNILKEKKKEFKGYNILDKIKNLFPVNKSVAPPALSEIKKNVSMKKSDQIEISQNFNERGSDYLFEPFKSKLIQKDSLGISKLCRNNFKKFKLKKILIKHTDTISCIIQINSGHIVSGSYDCKIIVWSISEIGVIKEINEEGVIFCLLEFKPNFLLVGNDKNNINLWNLENKKKIFSFSGHKLEVNCLVMCDDDNYFASSSKDKTIKIWDYNNRKELRTISNDEVQILCLIKLSNGNLCSGYENSSIKILDWRDGKEIQVLKGHEGKITSLCELDDYNILSADDNKIIKIWENYSNKATIDTSHVDQIQALCKIDDYFFASGSFDKTIKIWDNDQLECHQNLEGHSDKISCLLKLKNNNLVSGSYDKTIKIWVQE